MVISYSLLIFENLDTAETGNVFRFQSFRYSCSETEHRTLTVVRALVLDVKTGICVYRSEPASRGAYCVRSGSGRGVDSSWLRYSPIWRQHCHWQKTWAVSKSSLAPGRVAVFTRWNSSDSVLAPPARGPSSPRQRNHPKAAFPKNTASICTCLTCQRQSPHRQWVWKLAVVCFWFRKCLPHYKNWNIYTEGPLSGWLYSIPNYWFFSWSKISPIVCYLTLNKSAWKRCVSMKTWHSTPFSSLFLFAHSFPGCTHGVAHLFKDSLYRFKAHFACFTGGTKVWIVHCLTEGARRNNPRRCSFCRLLRAEVHKRTLGPTWK